MQILSKIISGRTTVRHYARSVGTLPNKGNNIREFSINGTTEKQHIPDLVQAFSQENGGF
jgi:hypothetical protein